MPSWQEIPQVNEFQRNDIVTGGAATDCCSENMRSFFVTSVPFGETRRDVHIAPGPEEDVRSTVSALRDANIISVAQRLRLRHKIDQIGSHQAAELHPFLVTGDL